MQRQRDDAPSVGTGAGGCKSGVVLRLFRRLKSLADQATVREMAAKEEAQEACFSGGACLGLPSAS